MPGANKGRRGYYGIAFYEPKFIENIGTIMRSAFVFDVDFIATINGRYSRTAMDTVDAKKHIPVFNYDSWGDFTRYIPDNCRVVALEVDGDRRLATFIHPKRALYVIGGEDRDVPQSMFIDERVRIDTSYCLNMGVAASILMYDRQKKLPYKPWSES